MESSPEMPAIHPVLAVAGLALPAINPALAAARLASTLHNTAKFADQNQAVWKDYHDIKDGDEARFIASATSSCISMKGLFESSVFELKEEDANGFRAVGSSKRTIKKQKIIPKRQRFGESRSSKQNQCQVYHYEAFYSSPITRGHEEKLSLSSSCDPCPCIDFSILMQNAKGEGSQPPEACNIIDVHGSSCKDLLNQVEKHRINEIATSSKIGAKPTEISQQYTSSKLTSKTSSSKDRHSKVATARGLRDRRVRLSPSCALQLFDIQDKLGFDQPSKAVDWLLDKAKHAIEQLPHTVNNSSLINMDNSLISTSTPYYKYYNSNPSSPKVSQKPSPSSNSNDESLELINHSPNYPLKSQTTSNLPIHCNLRGCESLSLSLSSMSNRSNDLVVGNDGEGQKPITLPSKPTRKESRDKARERARKRSSSKTSCDDQVISHTQFSLEL